MAAQLRPLKGREVLRKLRKAGFEIVRVKGSAYYLGTGFVFGERGAWWLERLERHLELFLITLNF